MTRKLERELERSLDDLEEKSSDTVPCGIREVWEYLRHVREHKADAQSPEVFFGGGCEWAPVLPDITEKEDKYPGFVESEDFLTPTPADLFALEYVGDEEIRLGVLVRLGYDEETVRAEWAGETA